MTPDGAAPYSPGAFGHMEVRGQQRLGRLLRVARLLVDLGGVGRAQLASDRR